MRPDAPPSETLNSKWSSTDGLGFWIGMGPMSAIPLRSRTLSETGEASGQGMTTSIPRSEEHTSELQSLMRISYAVFCLKNKKSKIDHTQKDVTYERHDTSITRRYQQS